MQIEVQTPQVNEKVLQYSLWFIAIVILVLVVKRLFSGIRFKSDNLQIPSSVGYNLTYPKETYRSFADGLYAAMNRAGTKERQIYDILRKLKTKDDWIYLKKRFGKQSCTRSCWGFKGGDLIEWLYNELDAGEIRKVNSILKPLGVMI